MIRSITDVLICPICRSMFSLEEKQLICRRHHAFDISTKGYVNLTYPVGRKQINIDTKAMVASRLRVQQSGLYDAITNTLVHVVKTCVKSGAYIAEFGAGPGYYLNKIVDSVGTNSRGVALDISQAAAEQAAQRNPNIGSVRANLRTLIPLRDSSIDLGLNIFAPRNASEMSRVLKPDAALIVVIPRPDHLSELQGVNAVLGIEPNKSKNVVNQLATLFDHESTQPVTWTMDVNRNNIEDIVSMGPSAFHEWENNGLTIHTLTGSVDVQVWRNRV